MLLQYSLIEVFTSESARWKGKPLWTMVVEFIRSHKLAARALVFRASGGVYESGEVANSMFEVLSLNAPLKIEIILPAQELDHLLPALDEMVSDGLITVQDRQVHFHGLRKHLLPKHLKVKDVMTADPKFVEEKTGVEGIVRILLGAPFSALPVLDAKRKVVGIVSQGDLLNRAGLPIRLGLLAEFEREKISALLQDVSRLSAKELMSHPARTVNAESELGPAVELMAWESLKRLPVVDSENRLVGVLSRMDVFRTVVRELPHWDSLQERNIQLGKVRLVRDIMHRDARFIKPEANLEEVLENVESSAIDAVAVVDADGKLLGLISDREAFNAFSDHKVKLWELLAAKTRFIHLSKGHRELIAQVRARQAADIMTSAPATAKETDDITQAMRTMTEKKLKFLPVLDAEGRFKGMIDREMVLKAALRDA